MALKVKRLRVLLIHARLFRSNYAVTAAILTVNARTVHAYNTVTVGVPTVVDAATLVNDTMDAMLSCMAESAPQDEVFYNMLSTMPEDERYGLITEILCGDNMFVTPKDVDAVIFRLANIISNSLNISLHPGITQDDINRYTSSLA